MSSIGTGYLVVCLECGRRIKGARYAECAECRKKMTTAKEDEMTTTTTTTTDNSFTAVNAVTALRAAMAVLADDLRGVRLGHIALSDAQVSNAEAISQCLDDLDDLGYPGHPGAPEAEQRVRRFVYQPAPAFRAQEFTTQTQW